MDIIREEPLNVIEILKSIANVTEYIPVWIVLIHYCLKQIWEWNKTLSLAAADQFSKLHLVRKC